LFQHDGTNSCGCCHGHQLGTPKPVTESKTKYNYCVAHLPPETASLVRDILLSPATDDPYKTLKEALIDRSGESGHQEIRRLLQGEHIGDRRPTELLRVMKRRAAAHQVPDKLMLELFLQHHPSHVQTVLAAVTPLTLDKAAEIAERVMEVSPVAVSACVLPKATMHLLSTWSLKKIQRNGARLEIFGFLMLKQ
ncbi:hypothetical protein JTE90_021753, partial [Oedothorax gibbosus]